MKKKNLIFFLTVFSVFISHQLDAYCVYLLDNTDPNAKVRVERSVGREFMIASGQRSKHFLNPRSKNGKDDYVDVACWNWMHIELSKNRAKATRNSLLKFVAYHDGDQVFQNYTDSKGKIHAPVYFDLPAAGYVRLQVKPDGKIAYKVFYADGKVLNTSSNYEE